MDIRPIIYAREPNGEFFNPYPSSFDNASDADEIFRRNLPEGFSTETVSGKIYRVQTIKLPETRVFYWHTERLEISEAVHINDITQECYILKTLYYGEIIALLFAAVLFLCFNYLFSNRAIRPIRRALQRQLEFAANISHELRNPLAVVTINSELLQKIDSQDDPIKTELISSILDSSHRMKSMLDELLMFARVSEEKTFSRNQINLGTLLEGLGKDCKRRAESKGLAYSCEIESGLTVLGDVDYLQKLFSTLIDNALEYTLASGSVMVTARKTENECEVRIADTGIGMSHEDLKRISERFYRGRRAEQVNPGGTGLGIPIALDIARQHDAQIMINSIEGEGTSVVVRFPLVEKSRPPA